MLKLLADRGESGTTFGQVSLGLLIFQDLAIVVMVLLVPMLAGTGGSGLDLAAALGKALAIILAVLLVARRLMPPLLERVARTCSPELFLLTVIAICFGTAWLTSVAGVSLSLGAFLAGLLVSESRFSHHAFGEIMPLQILFSAVFFVSVGMLLDLAFLLHHLPMVLGAVLFVLVVKSLTTMASVRALGYATPVAAASGLLLAQIGEFSFVLDRAGHEVGLSPAGLGETGSQAFIAASVMLMVVTPQLASIGARLGARLERRGLVDALPAADEELSLETFAHMSKHVVVAGYGEAARSLVRVLHGSHVPFVITTLSPGGALEAEAAGLPVLRGDSARQHTLLAAGIERATMVVIADDDPATAHRIVAVARSLAPTARIVVRTRYQTEAAALGATGTDLVVVEELESVVQLFADVLRTYTTDPAEIERYAATIRQGGYAALAAADDEETKAMSPRLRKDLDPATPIALDTHQRNLRPRGRNQGGATERAGLRRLPAYRRHLGPLASVHDVRPRRLLRLLAQPARDEALSPDHASHRALARARRGLGLVLPGRGDAVSSPLATELRRVEVLAGLTDEQLEWLASHGQVMQFGPGEMVFREGDPADSMFFILEGSIDLLIGVGGQMVPTFVQYAGEVTGLLPFSRMVKYTGAGRASARGPLRILRIHKDQFGEMLARIPVLGQRLVVDDDRPRARGHARRSSSARR